MRSKPERRCEDTASPGAIGMTDTHTEALAPCPFCGGDNLDVVGNDYVACDDCGADGPSCGLRMREGLAANAWNTRAAIEALPARDDERGWLIEDKSAGSIHYMALEDEPFHADPDHRCPTVRRRWLSPLRFTKDANEALRFGRKEDADAFVRVFNRFMLLPEVTEHFWPDIGTPPATLGEYLDGLNPLPARARNDERALKLDTVMLGRFVAQYDEGADGFFVDADEAQEVAKQINLALKLLDPEGVNTVQTNKSAQEVAFTIPGDAYPAFVNFKGDEDCVTITVRGEQRHDGSVGPRANIKLNRSDFYALIRDVGHGIYG
jgi:hypothetical protein